MLFVLFGSCLHLSTCTNRRKNQNIELIIKRAAINNYISYSFEFVGTRSCVKLLPSPLSFYRTDKGELKGQKMSDQDGKIAEMEAQPVEQMNGQPVDMD